MTLEDLGWNDQFAKEFKPYAKEGLTPARLIRDNKISYGALMADGEEREAIMSGKVYHDAECDAELPAVGDWVALDLSPEKEAVIRGRLTRQSCLSRKASGKSTEEQVIATNVDVVAVVTDPGPDLNLRRMERYFALIGRSKAHPVVLVNKADLFDEDDCREAADAIQALNPDADVHITSVVEGTALEALRSYLAPGKSITLIGSSGVGKSSVANQLLGEDYQWTDDVNELTGKGRHTTTARELIVLDDGGILIDNPGIREVHMWTDETTLRDRFADISKLAEQCKFHDCKHGTDKGCAIRAALERGDLDPARFEGFLKLDEEIATLLANRKKRQMTIERRTKRDKHSRAKKYQLRRDIDDEERYVK
ncbi:ribosome small subunit-dependent GTPase A [Sulfuriroseicoccus oceanibius]|uniref:Small ribosomal subunit biogenesis GTPase RsgA n=1 Tax=Sulfuriroseicoccus oceanibius TaxID=2707525 RepID=A0A6B3LCJ8_9BACT|nr:ribosome small subunit-dependent GTPase A [Sulfuriroseicoccus oceanibius]QQL46009.1 ribosome small subunit-dependent GTPase A [Sulfuriroseicoccus oceanibius]